MRCPSCSYDRSPIGSLVCNLCGVPLVTTRRQNRALALPEDPAVAELRTRTQAEAAERATRSDARRRRRQREHAIIGLVSVLGFQLLFAFPSSFLDLVVTIISSLVIGLPMGFIISRAGGGMHRGALIGAAWVVALVMLVQVVMTGQIAILGAIAGGLLAGGLPGAVIGTHVELDR